MVNWSSLMTDWFEFNPHETNKVPQEGTASDSSPDMVYHISIGVSGKQAERYIRMSGPDRDEFDSNVGKYIDQVWGDKYEGAVSDGST